MSRRAERAVLLDFGDRPRAAEHALAFLFLRLLGDRLAGSGGAANAWAGLAAVPEHRLGAVLDETCRGCERRWPVLKGFFDGVEFARSSARSLLRSMERVERVVSSSPAATCLAEAYQRTRSLPAKQWQGAFFTPYHVARLNAQLLDLRHDAWVLDPCVGGGVMLIAALDVVREQDGPVAALALTLLGVELDPRTAEVARAGLVLVGAGPDQFWIGTGNSLTQPLMGFDRKVGSLRPLRPEVVSTNPPFGKTSSRSARTDPADPLVVPERVL